MSTGSIYFPNELQISEDCSPEHPIGCHLFIKGPSWTNILRHILGYIHILVRIRPKTRIVTTPALLQYFVTSDVLGVLQRAEDTHASRRLTYKRAVRALLNLYLDGDDFEDNL